MVPLFKSLSKKLIAIRKKIGNNTEQQDIKNVSLSNLDTRTFKPIIEVVLQLDEFIVTIDSSLSVNWMVNGGYKGYAKDFSAVTSKVQLLSAQIDQLFSNKANKYKYKRIIAEALALALDEKESENALTLLKEVESRIKDYGNERVRIAYIFYASLATCIISILIGVFVHYRNNGWLFAGDSHLYQICITTLMGGIGAFISTFIRFGNYEGNIISGLSAHRLDGFLRILYGCIAALILGLAIYSNTILGFLNTSPSQWVIYFLATAAGASEFLIPNIVRSNKIKRVSESKSIFNKTEVREDNDKNSATEKKMANNRSINNNEDIETLYQQKEVPDQMQEEVVPDNNKSIEEIAVIENKEDNQNHETFYQPNAELNKIIEQDGDINNSVEEMIVIYDKKKQENHKILRHENENQKPNTKLQEEFKINDQLVQGKMDLQDY